MGCIYVEVCVEWEWEWEWGIKTIYLSRRFATTANGKVVDYATKWFEQKSMWVKCLTHKHVTLGVEATSPVESTHSAFKSWLLSFNGNLCSFVESR